MPMFAGIACLIFGNTCVMLGWFAGFPIDIVAGVINAICMFYTLYKRRLFRLNLLVSRRSSYVIAGMLSIILFANLVGTFQNILFEHFGLITKNYYVLVIAVAFTIVTAIIYTMLKKFIDAIFIKEEIQQSDSLKEFSNYVSKTLQVNEIVGAMGEIILKCVETKQVYICLLDDNGDYSIEYSSSPLRKNNYIINHENPVVIKLMNKQDIILMYIRDKKSKRAIARETGFARKTVDKYINEYEKHGYWKDAGIMLKGDAVWNLTVMFLSMWDYIDNKEEDYIKFKPSKNKYYNSKGYVQPFDDSPLINEPIGETVYLNLINKAKDYIYINTPYLIIDNEMATALKIAAKSGVDIKIVTPYIPDKKFVHAVTKSYYESFIKDGIEIYEFTPGFMHAKTFVVDDEYGVVGSINLDFRSLYLHYECGVWLYKTDSIKSMKDDYLETLKRCHKVTMEECKNTSSIRKVLRLIIRMFAPLL